MNKKITAVILAGGKSRRMGYPKPLLRIGKKSFLNIIKEKILKAGIKSIYLVLGSDAEFIKKNLNTENLKVIINKSWEQGQLSSLKAAIKKIKRNTDGVIMFLIDHPQVEVSTLRKLIEVFEQKDADIIVPEYNGRGGHPVIFHRNVFNALLKAPLDEGAKAVLRNKKYNTERVNVNDPYIRQDVDTPGEYSNIENKR